MSILQISLDKIRNKEKENLDNSSKEVNELCSFEIQISFKL